VIQWQHRPPVNQQANALERVITKIGQDAINKIHVNWASMEMDRANAKWQQLEGIIMNLIWSGFSECEIQAILPLGGSKISQLRKVLQDDIDMLHTRHPPCVPTHAFHDNDLDMIKVDAESWEVEDGFPCIHKRLKQYLLDLKLTFTKLYQRYKDKIKFANDGHCVVSYSCWIHYIHLFFPSLSLAHTAKDVCDYCVLIDIQL
jgi:hypothetical protein